MSSAPKAAKRVTAADDGQTVAMNHLLRATQREYQKMGKVVTDRAFEVKHENP